MNKTNSGNSLLDISNYYIPLDLSVVFGNKNEFVLEIGFGDGDFLIEMAQRHPEKNFLGIEIKTKRFKLAVKKAEEEKNGNIKFLHMNAGIAIEEIFTEDIFSQVYINFPDPWPKDRHRKHRIVNREFLQKLSKTMKKNGLLEIASDHKNYITHSLDEFNEITFFKSEYPPPGFLHNVPNRPYTKYEKEFRREGREIFYLRFTNNK
jgi:tRNA (guanine-N7-)-methyltransferase